MFLVKNKINKFSKKHIKPLRIVIGGGSLGLFFSHRISIEYPNSDLFIISKSIPDKTILIEDSNKCKSQFNFKNFIDSNKINKIQKKFNHKLIIFYICLPPEEVNASIDYIKQINKYNQFSAKNVIVFFNNGVINYHLFSSSFSKNEYFIIRSIVISGFMRIENENNILVKNTSGRIFYYGYYGKKNNLLKNILPKKYFEFKYSKSIFKLEKAKFLTNLLLGLFINKRLLTNKEIFPLVKPATLDEIFYNYSILFKDKKITPHFLKYYFNQAIKQTESNINSISYAWYHGNTKPIEYFLAKLQELSYLSNNSKAKNFFEKLISLKNSSN
ncbi:hypothetical protein QEJ31_04665 [Pigmentibacter sp. JX0631]|uniref:hypothetical protein n=1 Tax=Pigmentibacter sp. JX0631 TaxID=2976982 RepID=UPI00246849AB|nr:hypothetical protein [Pigmentibacter sp. JX0631]WGL60889.1 hypothetical protein QEJ31_04665 [Pigmentibacter sp. JX0631]